jgi:hypothetical protein
MRTTLSVLAGVALWTSAAHADVAGTYEVKYEEVSTNCTTQRLTYAPGVLKVKVVGNSLIVDIDRTPEMVGVPQKNGKISAKSMAGVFSVAGRITDEGMLHFVMVGEYSANGKSLCTQSWNVSGPRARASASPTRPPKAP